jgi:hypothetical protein
MTSYAILSGVTVTVCILCLCILCSAAIRMELYSSRGVLAAVVNNTNSIDSGINATTNTKAFGPPQVFESKPTGNYTNGTASVTEGPRQIIQSKPTGNYTNGTASVPEGPRQIITGRPGIGQVAPQNQFGQNKPVGVTDSSVINIPNINITKEQAAKAEQEASIMIKAYYEKLEQEKQEEKEEAAALAPAAAAQSNQTPDGAEDTLDETETGTEEEEEDDQENEEDKDNENEDNVEEDNE